jgi:hypothetical protein
VNRLHPENDNLFVTLAAKQEPAAENSQEPAATPAPPQAGETTAAVAKQQGELSPAGGLPAKTYLMQVEETVRFWQQVEVQATNVEEAKELALEEYQADWENSNQESIEAIPLRGHEEEQRREQRTASFEQEPRELRPAQHGQTELYRLVPDTGKTILFSPRTVKALNNVLNYCWDAEKQDYEANPRPNHVFLELQHLAEVQHDVEVALHHEGKFTQYRDSTAEQRGCESEHSGTEPKQDAGRRAQEPIEHQVKEEQPMPTDYERNYQQLMELLGESESDHARIVNDPFMQLVVERISEDQVSMMHFYLQEGDVMSDPNVVFILDNKIARPGRRSRGRAGLMAAS